MRCVASIIDKQTCTDTSNDVNALHLQKKTIMTGAIRIHRMKRTNSISKVCVIGYCEEELRKVKNLSGRRYIHPSDGSNGSELVLKE